MADEEDDEKPGPLLSIALLVLLTIVGVTLGAVVGQQVLGEGFERRQAQPSEEEEVETVPLYEGDTKLIRLTPVVTNLASPKDTWIRVEAAVVLNEDVTDPNVLASQISEDVLAYLRTVSLPEIQGASGLLHLKEDLNDRASIRSNNGVRELIVEALVVQ